MSPAVASPPRRVDRRVLRAACRELASRDEHLGRALREFGEPPLWGRPPGFATLVQIILEQQISLESGRAAFERLETAAGAVTPEAVAALDLTRLRRAGLTRQKAAYCRGLAEAVRDGGLRLRRVARADDEGARAQLCAVKGIGPWTADVYLLFALRRPDIWPPGDLALLHALREVKGLRRHPTGERAARIARTWRPWRSVAARVLWHAYLSSRGRSVPTASKAR